MTPRNIKNSCPKCGTNKFRTKLFHQGDTLFIGNSHCYKCGHHVGTCSTETRARKTTWSPPEPKESDVGRIAA